MASDFTAKLLALVFLEDLLDPQSGKFPISINELLASLLLGIETGGLVNQAVKSDIG